MSRPKAVFVADGDRVGSGHGIGNDDLLHVVAEIIASGGGLSRAGGIENPRLKRGASRCSYTDIEIVDKPQGRFINHRVVVHNGTPSSAEAIATS